MIYRQDLKLIHQMLDPHFTKLLNNPDLSSIVLNGLTTVQRLSTILSFLLFLSCVAYVATPLGFIIYQYFHHVDKIKYILPIPAVYPWENPSGFLYILQYMADSISLTANILVGSGMDMLLPLYVFQLGGQLREMSYKITHINKTSDYKSVIRDCVLQHESIIICRNKIQRCFGIIILWIILTNAISRKLFFFLVFQLIFNDKK